MSSFIDRSFVVEIRSNVTFNSFWFSFLVALSLQEEQQQEHPAAMHDEIGDVGEDVAKTLAEDEKNAQELLEYVEFILCL